MRLGAILLLAAAVVSGGCTLPPQQPIELAEGTLGGKTGTVGVAMNALPKVDTYFPGADCLLCFALASAANRALTQHVQTLPTDDLAALKADVAEVLRANEATPLLIQEAIDLKSLPNIRPEEAVDARKDFSSLGAKYGIDQLLVLNIPALGFTRTYASYIPTSDPKVMIDGEGYLVDLKTNTYLWYVPVRVSLSADGEWDEPEGFPGLTNAYYQAIEASRDTILKPLRNNSVVKRP